MMANPYNLYQKMLRNELSMADMADTNLPAGGAMYPSPSLGLEFYRRMYMDSYLTMAAGLHNPRPGPLIENLFGRSRAMSLANTTCQDLPDVKQSKNGLELLQRAACLDTPSTPSSPSSSSPPSPKEKQSKLSTTSEDEKSVDNSDSEASSKRIYIDRVREFDVLCGRGGRSNHHSGNKKYRQVVDEMKLRYRNTEAKTAKTDLSRAIVDYVCNYGGRFIKKEGSSGKYYLLTRAEARKKTSQALRETKSLKWTYNSQC